MIQKYLMAMCLEFQVHESQPFFKKLISDSRDIIQLPEKNVWSELSGINNSPMVNSLARYENKQDNFVDYKFVNDDKGGISDSSDESMSTTKINATIR